LKGSATGGDLYHALVAGGHVLHLRDRVPGGERGAGAAVWRRIGAGGRLVFLRSAAYQWA